MVWNDLPLESVITRNLYYFDESKKDICERICKKLEIDCFPDLNTNKFWILEDEGWSSNELTYNLDDIQNPFDERLLGLFKNNVSNIAFASSNSLIDGIIHFTNYENEDVFSNLYRNLHVFEKNLRYHLISLDLNFEYLKEYIENHINKSNDGDKHRYEEMMKRINKEGVNELNPYQELDFGELLNFSVSSFHNDEMRESIGIKKLAKEDIHINDVRDLRNTVMHSKQVSGENKYKLHEFSDFEVFFSKVLKFKKAFLSLSKTIADNRSENKGGNIAEELKLLEKKSEEREIINSRKLELIGRMNDSEIKACFYTNY